MKEDLRSFTLEECEELAEKLNWPSFRGRQIFQWVQQKGVEDIDSISNLSLDQRAVLSESTEISGVKLVFRDESSRGDTQKLLLEFPDRQRVEMALMLYSPQNTRDRATCCVSTQTGCKMGCAFCATGMFKENRNLSAGEIVSQVLKAREIAIKKGYEGITNVVYMGMGEPLLNLEAVRKSLLILNDAKGQNIGMRRMTVSTCGLIPQIYEMASWGLQIGLALSLHAPDDQIRSQLMPINKKYPINQLMEACKDYFEITGRRVTYEYALFKNVNDGPVNAHKLGKLLSEQDCLVNLIPANPVDETGFCSPEVEEIEAFISIVSSYNVNIQRREPKGQDINAACGQLRRR